MKDFWILVLGFVIVETSSQREVRLSIAPVTAPNALSEGPHWDEANQVLYFVDIPAQKILCLNPATGRVTEAYIKNGPVSVAVPVADNQHKFLVGSGTDLMEIEWDPSTNDSNPIMKVLSSVDEDRIYTRFNDGKVDPAGRLWAGTMGQINMGELIDDIGSLYRFAADGTPSRILSPVSISNGLCWSLDNTTFYYVDSPTLQVVAYDFNISSGDISNKRVIFSLETIHPDEIPDGLTIDKDGYLWVAVHDGGRVIQIDPKSGEQLRHVTLPAMKITSVAFGGPNLDVLYVTSARKGLTPDELREQPLAGSVFAVHNLGVFGTRMLDVEM